MAEVQKTNDAGLVSQLFIQFIMLQSQQALLALGRHPNPPPDSPPANLRLARAFIDQLGMIREKTRGNLEAEETQVLETTIGNLQRLFIEATAPA